MNRPKQNKEAGDSAILRTAGQKFPRKFEKYLDFFAIFWKFYLFIPRFLAEPWLGNVVLGHKFLRSIT